MAGDAAPVGVRGRGGGKGWGAAGGLRPGGWGLGFGRVLR